jgi:hypothetical protein
MKLRRLSRTERRRFHREGKKMEKWEQGNRAERTEPVSRSSITLMGVFVLKVIGL